jgi:copper(I)-binding protein
MTYLRNALIASLLISPLLAQGKTVSASDITAVIVKNGVAIYATLNNPTMYDAYVQSGTSELGKVELREGEAAASNISVPSFGSVELKAGGPFVLVTGLKTQPKAGDSISLTLMTDGGDKIAVAAIIK